MTAPPATAAEVTATIDGVVYTADDSQVSAGATASDYTGPGGAVSIPSTVTIGGQQYAVTTVGELAFVAAGLTSVDADAFIPLAGTSMTTHFSFTGPPPAQLDEVGGAGSLGQASRSVVHVRQEYVAPLFSGGYTLPTWKGYPTTTDVLAPVYTGPLVTSGTVGKPYSWTPMQFGGNPAATATVTAGSLPPGVTLDPTLGSLSGTPTTAGTYAVTLTASNRVAPAKSLPLTITIGDPTVEGLAPVITGEPREGRTLGIDPGTLDPADATVTYQWFADGVAITKATKKTLKLGKAQAGRQVTVRVTASAPGLGSVTETSAPTPVVSSSKARLVVSPRTIDFDTSFTVRATGLKPHMPVRIWLGGQESFKGYADANGTVDEVVAFVPKIKPGTRLVRVSGYKKVESDGDYEDRKYTITTTVKYLKP